MPAAAEIHTAARAKPAPNAIRLLKNDHREVEDWSDAFEETSNGPRKQKLARQICTALTIHTKIEEEIFYPACREAGVEDDLMDEAVVEHGAAKKLIAEIEAGKPGDEHWDAKVKVLGEMIQHHVKEEEQMGGIFSKARRAGLDLEELGQKMQARKDALMKRAKARR
ncbi:MAG: hemerythrin domain-containing protein [Terricaulis sp.]|nr:hemerythrin domain-containing protein [Terricaulis sp.]